MACRGVLHSLCAGDHGDALWRELSLRLGIVSPGVADMSGVDSPFLSAYDSPRIIAQFCQSAFDDGPSACGVGLFGSEFFPFVDDDSSDSGDDASGRYFAAVPLCERHTEAALWRRLPLRDLARLLVASGTSCVAGKGLIAITGITDAPTALVAALAVAVMMYMVIGRWLGLEFRPLRGGEVPDNKIV